MNNDTKATYSIDNTGIETFSSPAPNQSPITEVVQFTTSSEYNLSDDATQLEQTKLVSEEEQREKEINNQCGGLLMLGIIVVLLISGFNSVSDYIGENRSAPVNMENVANKAAINNYLSNNGY
jgi:hypothetical protein